MKKCRIAFCGTGNWVKSYHIPALLKKADRYQIMGFYDLFPEKARETAGDQYKAYGSLDDLAHDPDVDVVLVATKPVPTHFESVMTLLEAGKNVICEKPMTYESAQCDRMIAKAREKGVILTVHHNMRFSTSMKAALEVIRTGHVGDPVMVEIVSPRSWYDKIDFSNYAAHMTDQALAINHTPLKEVTAQLLHPEEGMAGAGYGCAFLRFEKPPVVRLSLNPLPTKQIQPDDYGHLRTFRMYVTGTKDCCGIGDFGPTPQPDQLNTQKYHYFDNEAPDFSDPAFQEDLGKDFYDAFYGTWANGDPLAVTPEQARNVIRCIELMVESSKLNKAVPATNMLPTEFKRIV